MQRTYRQAASTYSGADPEELAHLALTQEVAIAALIDDGAVYVANCVARSESEPTTLCTAQFVILVQEADLPMENPLSVLANGLKEPGEPRETVLVEYPAAEAVLVGEERAVTPTMLPSGRANSETHRMRQAQVIMPFPGNRRIAVMSVSSQYLQEWPHFTRMLDDIAQSIRFDDGEQEAGIGDRLNPGGE